jgi:transposase
LDSSQRCALEGSTQALSLTEHLLASFRCLDASGDLGASLVTPVTAAGLARTSGHRRDDRRRHICLGKKRGECVGKTKRGKGTKIMVHSDGNGLPLGVHVTSASPNEVTLIEPLLEKRQLRRLPKRILYDLAADSDPLRTRLLRRGIELVCSHRSNRVRPPTQDGRKLRRFRRRWKIERSISWLQNFRRLVTRYEYHARLFLGFVQLACLVIVLRRF